jgi:hypothetical protein
VEADAEDAPDNGVQDDGEVDDHDDMESLD